MTATVVPFTPPACIRQPGQPRQRHQWGSWTPNHATGRYVAICGLCGKTRARTSIPAAGTTSTPPSGPSSRIAGRPPQACPSCGGSGWRFLDGTAEVIRCDHEAPP